MLPNTTEKQRGPSCSAMPAASDELRPSSGRCRRWGGRVGALLNSLWTHLEPTAFSCLGTSWDPAKKESPSKAQDMDGPRDYHTKWSKSDRERQISQKAQLFLCKTKKKLCDAKHRHTDTRTHTHTHTSTYTCLLGKAGISQRRNWPAKTLCKKTRKNCRKREKLGETGYLPGSDPGGCQWHGGTREWFVTTWTKNSLLGVSDLIPWLWEPADSSERNTTQGWCNWSGVDCPGRKHPEKKKILHCQPSYERAGVKDADWLGWRGETLGAGHIRPSSCVESGMNSLIATPIHSPLHSALSKNILGYMKNSRDPSPSRLYDKWFCSKDLEFELG